MTHLSGMESESDLSEVPTMANVLGVYSRYLGGGPVSLGEGYPEQDRCGGSVRLRARRSTGNGV
jgi:hypothetical protein